MRYILIFLAFSSCNLTNNDNNLTISFEYFLEGGKEILQTDNLKNEVISINTGQNNIEINVYKWLGLPIDGYNGKSELKSDTLYLYFWEEIKEANRNIDHASLILPSLLKYKVKNIKYKGIKVERLIDTYIK